MVEGDLSGSRFSVRGTRDFCGRLAALITLDSASIIASYLRDLDVSLDLARRDRTTRDHVSAVGSQVIADLVESLQIGHSRIGDGYRADTRMAGDGMAWSNLSAEDSLRAAAVFSEVVIGFLAALPPCGRGR